jgi:hypothetical protein
MLSGNRVGRCRSEFNHIEDRVETLHGEGQLEPVCIARDLSFDQERSKPSVGEFAGWSSRLDIGCVQIN